MVKSKPYGAEPLRIGQSIGAALAISGVARSAPLLLGAQGCAATVGSLLARHFRRAAPIRSVAMNEISMAFGAEAEIAKAVAAADRQEGLELIALISSGVNETRGDDLAGLLQGLGDRRPGSARLVAVSTPDFAGSLQDGWSRAVETLVAVLVEPAARKPRQVALLPGCHLAPADIEALKELCRSFSLEPIAAPDLSGALDRRDGAESFGVATLDNLRALGASSAVLGFGAHMRRACEALAALSGAPVHMFEHPFGLAATDDLIAALTEISGQKAAASLRRGRDRLIDVMADAGELFAGRRAVLAGEADMAVALAALFAEWGLDVEAAVIAASAPGLSDPRFTVGDFEDVELASENCDVIAAPSGARHAAARLDVPLWRCGLPVTDRIDAAFRVQIGYSAARRMICDMAALLIDRPQASRRTNWMKPLRSATRS